MKSIKNLWKRIDPIGWIDYFAALQMESMHYEAEQYRKTHYVSSTSPM